MDVKCPDSGEADTFELRNLEVLGVHARSWNPSHEEANGRSVFRGWRLRWADAKERHGDFSF
jgi:hypothetical protein